MLGLHPELRDHFNKVVVNEDTQEDSVDKIDKKVWDEVADTLATLDGITSEGKYAISCNVCLVRKTLEASLHGYRSCPVEVKTFDTTVDLTGGWEDVSKKLANFKGLVEGEVYSFHIKYKEYLEKELSSIK